MSLVVCVQTKDVIGQKEKSQNVRRELVMRVRHREYNYNDTSPHQSAEYQGGVDMEKFRSFFAVVHQYVSDIVHKPFGVYHSCYDREQDGVLSAHNVGE